MSPETNLDKQCHITNLKHLINTIFVYSILNERCLVISARLSAEQAAVLVKSIESASEALLSERKSVPAGTFSEDTNDFETDVSEPFAAQRTGALVLMMVASGVRW